jgi:hypothetical protein
MRCLVTPIRRWRAVHRVKKVSAFGVSRSLSAMLVFAKNLRQDGEQPRVSAGVPMRGARANDLDRP